jgi:hypothetical protein
MVDKVHGGLSFFNSISHPIPYLVISLTAYSDLPQGFCGIIITPKIPAQLDPSRRSNIEVDRGRNSDMVNCGSEGTYVNLNLEKVTASNQMQSYSNI